MATITTEKKVFTVINVFTVAPKDQQILADNLFDFIDKLVKPKQGFISANVHKSEDGIRVVNYAQWESREAWLAMERDPVVSAGMEEQSRIAKSADFHIYDVSFVIEPEM